MVSTLEHFDLYRDKLNWDIIAIRSRTKQPIFKSWTEYYNPNKHREYVERTPNANIGLLLGRILDIEGDTPEANNKINDWLKDFDHMSFRSEKSIHHLFLNPFKSLTVISKNGIEFRGYKHQSLLPPSINKNGVKYTWMPESLRVPGPLPRHVHEIIKLRLEGNNEIIEPWCSSCKQKCSRNIKRFNLELRAFKLISSPWKCLKCREVDVRQAVRLIKANKIDKAKNVLLSQAA